MPRPFTVIGALLLFVVAAAHALRIAADLPLTVGGHDLPMAVSWIAAVLSAFIAMMMIVELRR